MKERVLSGMRPSGSLHLGNLLGALNNWIKLQDEYECLFFVANWHGLTDQLNTGQLKRHTYQMLRDWLAAGINPEKCSIFLQSDVPGHAELHLLLSMVTPVSWLERCPTYKEKIEVLKMGKNVSYGLLGYPVLQTADIFIYKASKVPVGEDQLPHLEISREIARRFNHLFGKIFPEPQALLTPGSRLLGLDGKKKMGKSYNNYISLSDPPEEIKKKTQSMFTDPTRIKRTDPGHPLTCNVYSYYKFFTGEEVSAQLNANCKKAKIGCTDCKKNLSAHLIEFLAPFWEKQKKYSDIKIKEILGEGSKKAGKIAQETMAEVREAMHLWI